MAEIPVPFTGEEIDTDDGSGAVKTGALLIGGFTVFSMFSSFGDVLAQKASNKVAQYTGYNPISGQSTGGDVV